jgi:hypothetical protein
VALAILVPGCADEDGDSSSKVPDCSSGSTSKNIDSDVPDWIENNFTCIRASVDGNNIVIQTRDLPPYKSYYWGSSSDRYDPTVPTKVNPNKIAEQNVKMTVPASPAVASAPSASGLGVIGIAVDGVGIFNDEAAPGDVLADELDTFDVNSGHPTSGGMYHYHSEPANLTIDKSALVGIAIDGFPIFGRTNESGSSVFATGNNWHTADDTSLFSDNTPHYHIVYDNPEKQTDGDTVQVRYMVGTYLGGTVGTVTD